MIFRKLWIFRMIIVLVNTGAVRYFAFAGAARESGRGHALPRLLRNSNSALRQALNW